MPFAIFGFALAAAYVPGIVGAAASPRWVVLTAGAAVLCCLARIIDRISLAHLFGGLFLLWAVLNRSAAPETFDLMWKVAAVAVLFLVGTGIDSLRGVLIGAAIGVGLSSALVTFDLAGVISYPQVSRPSGLFVNGLYLAEFAAIVAVGLLAYREWWWAALCAPSLALVTLARGPLVALAVAGIVWVWSRSRTWALVLILLGICMVQAAIGLRPETVIERMQTWADVGRNLTWLGHGFGSYFAEAPFLHKHVNRNYHANNDLLEITYELGLPGLVLAISFLAVLLWPRPASMSERAARMMVIVFAVEGCFGFPFHLPWSVGLFALAAGRLARYGGGRFLESGGGGVGVYAGDAHAKPAGQIQPSAGGG